jgi:hypothetical protein
MENIISKYWNVMKGKVIDLRINLEKFYNYIVMMD